MHLRSRPGQGLSRALPVVYPSRVALQKNTLEARTAHALSLENPGPDCHMNIWELRTVMRGLADWTLSQHGQVGLARRAKPDGLASLRTRPVAALRA